MRVTDVARLAHPNRTLNHLETRLAPMIRLASTVAR
jgi:hypothetical protein